MRTWRNPSKSDPDRTYETVLADDGKLLCNCNGWTRRRPNQPRHCTHTKEVVADLGGNIEVRGEFVYLPSRAIASGLDGQLGADIVAEIREKTRRVDRDTVVAAAKQIAKDVRAGTTTFGPGPDGTHVVRVTAPNPMLASAMVDEVKGKAFDQRYGGTGYALERKLDGHRCLTVITGGDVQAFSRPRQGKTALPRVLPAHIVTELRRFPDCVVDGELVSPSGKAWDVTTVGAHLVYVLFDVLHVQGTDIRSEPYSYRREVLLDGLRLLPPTQTAISTVESVTPTWAGVQAIWDQGGEGAVIKRLDSIYREGYRTPDWVKVKKKQHRTLIITGFKAGKTGPYSSIELRDGDGIDTTIKTPDNATYRAIEANPMAFLGRCVVIEYQEQTPSGAYRHPMFDHFAGPGE